MEPVPYRYDERGPLAFTHSVDGEILPFSEVACDKVRSSLQNQIAPFAALISQIIVAAAPGKRRTISGVGNPGSAGWKRTP